jgi:hypothetical protein
LRPLSLTLWLQRAHPFWFSVYAAGAAFCLYTCIYSFRKAFSVATFDGLMYLGINYKVWLVVFQVIGYALSKFIGIKVIAELKSNSRKTGILLMAGIAGVSLFLFAITPSPYNILFLFTNGLPLGMVWGMIFSYLEGRKNTELLGAGLSVSFIFSSGFVKSIGSIVMSWGISEWWMPFVTGCLFFFPLILFLWMLDQLPSPTAEDIALRTKRQPMDASQRRNFALTFAPGLILLILAYALLTALRDFRDNFSAEIWNSLGYGGSPEIFTLTEIPISILVLIVMGSIMFIRSNQTALIVIHYIIFAGMVLIGLSTYLFEMKLITAPLWIILVGLGLYLGYVPFNCIFFERLIATFRYAGNIGFVMYLADSFGYLGSVGVLLYKEFGFQSSSWINFFIQSGYAVAFLGSIFILFSLLYFQWKYQRWKNPSYKPAIEIS